MTKSKELFHQIINDISDAVEGKMFGASCIKYKNGKAVAILWKDTMLFKLDSKSRKEALKLKDTCISSHLYAPDKPMNNWVTIPLKYADKWTDFTKNAIKLIKISKE